MYHTDDRDEDPIIKDLPPEEDFMGYCPYCGGSVYEAELQGDYGVCDDCEEDVDIDDIFPDPPMPWQLETKK